MTVALCGGEVMCCTGSEGRLMPCDREKYHAGYHAAHCEHKLTERIQVERTRAAADKSSEVAELLQALQACVASHCPNQNYFCSACSPARKLIARIANARLEEPDAKA